MVMKKFLALIVLTVISLVCIHVIPNFIVKRQPKSIDVITAVPVTAQSTVIASGRVEYTDFVPVTVSTMSIIKESHVKTNSRVKKGDKLFTVSEVTLNRFPSETELNKLRNINDAIMALSSRENYIETGVTKQICAPTDGIVTCLSYSGDRVLMSNSTLCNVVNGNSFSIRVPINESQVSRIKEGQSVIITGSGFSGEYEGHVQSVSKEATQLTGFSGQETVVDTIIAVDSCVPDLKHGFTAKCKIITDESENVMILPYESIKSENGNQYVYKVTDCGTVEKVYITTGKEYETGIEILSGIQADDTIVEKGDQKDVERLIL